MLFLSLDYPSNLFAGDDDRTHSVSGRLTIISIEKFENDHSKYCFVRDCEYIITLCTTLVKSIEYSKLQQMLWQKNKTKKIAKNEMIQN